MKKLRSLRSVLLALLIVAIPAIASAGISIFVNFGPPALPVYEQPYCPGEGYIWTPGYWAWAGDGYYWVPGTWVLAPFAGALWTPPYWGWNNGRYGFYDGYWGNEVGFYGGVNYGFGYGGEGYEGGRWDNGRFAYNTSVNRVDTTIIHNTYNQTVINNYNTERVSYNGGKGGTAARPTPQQVAFAQAKHTPPTPTQVQHIQQAAKNPVLRASTNQGHPPIAATPKPAAFNTPGIVPAKNAPPHLIPKVAAANATANAAHPAPNTTRPAPNTAARPAPNTTRPTPNTATTHPAPANNQRPLITAHPSNNGTTPVQTRPGTPASNARTQPTTPQQRVAPEAQHQTQARPVPQEGAPQERTPVQQHAAAPPPRVQQERPAPEARPMPQERSAPQARPMPQERSAPQERPAPQARPMPQEHSAPQARPAPQERPEQHPPQR